MKTFLVEDSQDVCERLCSLMACIPDVELVAVEDNEDDAVRGIGTLQPDVVILDLTLSGGSGLEVLRRIRLQPFFVRVIVFTNNSSPQYRKKCFDLGADYFLDKTKGISMLEELLIRLKSEFENESS